MFWVTVIPVGVKWYHMWFRFVFPWWFTTFSIFFCACWSFTSLPCRNVYSSPLPGFVFCFCFFFLGFLILPGFESGCLASNLKRSIRYGPSLCLVLETHHRSKSFKPCINETEEPNWMLPFLGMLWVSVEKGTHQSLHLDACGGWLARWVFSPRYLKQQVSKAAQKLSAINSGASFI